MRLIPTFSNVALEKRLANKKLKLILPGKAVENSNLGAWYVTAIGPDVKTVKVDEQVMFNTKEAGEADFEGRRIVVVAEKEIVAVVRE